ANGGGAQQRQVQVATASQAQPRTTNNSALPGVKRRDLFGTIFGSSDDKANEAAEVRVASVAGYALISRNGLIRQHEGVRVSCFKPSLLRVLKQVERKFGKKVIVTSGYRSPKNNRRAGGARNSRHTYCDAADIQVAGVSKWTLAKYLRTLPTRGGVGTYCHTKSVHIDTYKKRDWNWACRKRKRRRG
ncbi:MAG: D-Ala-D-Ala carboxypeptidase family metallohydrolase, partial [Pseudomonadota bacterium]